MRLSSMLLVGTILCGIGALSGCQTGKTVEEATGLTPDKGVDLAATGKIPLNLGTSWQLKSGFCWDPNGLKYVAHPDTLTVDQQADIDVLAKLFGIARDGALTAAGARIAADGVQDNVDVNVKQKQMQTQGPTRTPQ